ncbi:unnamed protein product [Timema podura]|uniref:Neurotransmitter-gated ion-channel ligand-binding domain-containing protein n=1 Tax=Timema podura TaxID=61482 RepID=A0ABN7NCZ2_TIMPD|nr:unnamed protein product [Timema podura]
MLIHRKCYRQRYSSGKVDIGGVVTGTEQGPHERRLLNALLDHYNTLERPVSNESEPLEVKFGLTLQQIIDVRDNKTYCDPLVKLKTALPPGRPPLIGSAGCMSH